MPGIDQRLWDLRNAMNSAQIGYGPNMDWLRKGWEAQLLSKFFGTGLPTMGVPRMGGSIKSGVTDSEADQMEKDRQNKLQMAMMGYFGR